jgi:hypothetical protein
MGCPTQRFNLLFDDPVRGRRRIAPVSTNVCQKAVQKRRRKVSSKGFARRKSIPIFIRRLVSRDSKIFFDLFICSLFQKIPVIPGSIEIIPVYLQKNSRFGCYGNCSQAMDLARFFGPLPSPRGRNRKNSRLFSRRTGIWRSYRLAQAAAFLPAMRPKTAPDIRPVPLA